MISNGLLNKPELINSAMVQAYWQIGRLIVEDEQQGQTRAEYGKALLKQLSAQLTNDYGKGFDITNLRNMRRFYLSFEKRETVSLELSWSHYNVLSRLENPAAREWYQQEANDKTQPLAEITKEYLRDPYILDFLNLQDKTYQESDLELAIISNLQQFLLELGKGFAFVERQRALQASTQQQKSKLQV